MKGLSPFSLPFVRASLFVFYVFAWLIPPAAGHGISDEACDALEQTVLATYAPHQQPASEASHLEWIASGARQAFDCYGSSHTQRRIRLLHTEVEALRALNRFQEAKQRVHLFYTLLADSATVAFKAHFSMHRLHLCQLREDFAGAMAAYEHARRYAYALPPEDQAHVVLAGAHLFNEAGHYEQAARMAEEVLTMHGDGMDLAHARALFVRSYARFHQERLNGPPSIHVLHRIAADLEGTAARFRAFGAPARYSRTLAVLGEVYTASGQHTEAQHRFDEALRLARETADVRGEVFVLLCRGRAHRAQQAFKQAKEHVETALTLAESTVPAPFKADLLMELGTLYEHEHRWNDAARQFQAVLDQVSCTLSATYTRAREALVRVRLARVHEHRTAWLVACFILIILLLGVSGHSLYVYRQLRATRTNVAPIRRPQPPAPLPTRRLAYLHAVLEHPHEVADLIAPLYPDLGRRLGNYRLRSRSELYRYVGALEHTLEDRELGNPEDAIRIDLTRHFKRNEWTWPRSFEAWQAHFEEHPPPIPIRFAPTDEENSQDDSAQDAK